MEHVKRTCVFPNSPKLASPLTNHQVTSECFCAVGPLRSSQQPPRVLSFWGPFNKNVHGPLCYTLISKVQNSGHTACLAKTLQPQLQEKHTCPPKVVFMHCVSSRQALPRSQDSLENVSLSGRSRHDDYCVGEGGTFKALLFFPLTMCEKLLLL